MENSPTLTYFVISTLITGGTAVITWLVRQNVRLQERLDATNKETIDALRSAAKLGERVPEMSVQLQQSSDENRMLRDETRELRQRISDLERR